MALRDWLRCDAVATATIATPATKPVFPSRTVASVAEIAVAEPWNNDLPTDHQEGRQFTGTGIKKGLPTDAAINMAKAKPNLPAGCPLLGDPVPAGCRFDPRCLRRMVSEETLPLPGGGCPLRHVCGLTEE
jgi:hypothetical protein